MTRRAPVIVRHLAHATLVAAIAALSISGCTSTPTRIPDPVELHCVWESADGTRLELQPYGVLSYSGWPPRLDGAGDSAGEGKWEYGNGVHLRSLGGTPVLSLLIGTTNSELQVRQDDGALKLFYDSKAPEPDRMVMFEPSECLDTGDE